MKRRNLNCSKTPLALVLLVLLCLCCIPALSITFFPCSAGEMGCVGLSVSKIPGVGFFLTAEYGTVSINHPNDNTTHVAKIEGSPAYKAFMQRAYHFAYTSSPPSPPSDDDLATDIAALQPLLTRLKHAAERALGYQRVCHVLLGGPKRPFDGEGGYYERTMLGALAAADLRPARDWLSLRQGEPAHVTSSALSAAWGALRLDGLGEDWWEGYYDVLIMVVEATQRGEAEKGGLGVVTAAVLDGGISTVEVGMEEMEGGGDVGEVVERVVRDVVGRVQEADWGAVQTVVVHEDGARVSGVREALERVFGEAIVSEAFREEGDDEAVFEAADGQARVAYDNIWDDQMQKAAFGCRFMSGSYEYGWRDLWDDAVQFPLARSVGHWWSSG